MGWILDMYEGPTLPFEFVRKIETLEAQFKVLESENVTLITKIQELEKQIADVQREKQEVLASTFKTTELHNTDLDDAKTSIITALGTGYPASLDNLGRHLMAMLRSQHKRHMETTVILYHLEELEDKGYVESAVSSQGEKRYTLTREGRKYFAEHDLSL
jgi:hypothetical protein